MKRHLPLAALLVLAFASFLLSPAAGDSFAFTVAGR